MPWNDVQPGCIHTSADTLLNWSSEECINPPAYKGNPLPYTTQCPLWPQVRSQAQGYRRIDSSALSSFVVPCLFACFKCLAILFMNMLIKGLISSLVTVSGCHFQHSAAMIWMCYHMPWTNTEVWMQLFEGWDNFIIPFNHKKKMREMFFLIRYMQMHKDHLK